MKKIFDLTRKETFIFLFIVIMNFLQGQFYYLAKFFPKPALNLNNHIDDMIPFISTFIYPYVLWHILLFLVPLYFYKKDKESFYRYFTANLICDVFCILIFILFPTIIIRPSIEINSLSTFLVELVYIGDTPAANCFPSLHCTTSFLFIYIFANSKKLSKNSKFWGIIIFSSIILSTLFVKQHVLIDVIGAFVLSFVIYISVTNFGLVDKMKNFVEKKLLVSVVKEKEV